MRYDVSELTIPSKFAGLSGNVLLIYLILYMRLVAWRCCSFYHYFYCISQAPLVRLGLRRYVLYGSRPILVVILDC